LTLPAGHCELNGPNRSACRHLRGRHYGEASERAHDVKHLAFAGLPGIPAKANADPIAVLRRGIEQQSLDVARAGSPEHHIQEPVSAILIASQLIPTVPNAAAMLRDRCVDAVPADLDIVSGIWRQLRADRQSAQQFFDF